jgi:very-short-patch-repair endonuclease
LTKIKSNLTQLAKNLRANQTDVEKLLWKHLRAKQLKDTKFRRQQPIGHYIVDFVSFDEKLIIELDGGQHAIEVRKDQERDAWFAAQGFKVVRFWNNDVLQNIEGVWKRLWSFYLPPPAPPTRGGGIVSG